MLEPPAPRPAAAGHRAIAFTQRGYSPGARFDDVEAYTLDKLVGDVLDVADTLGFDRFDVVGHDFGGGIAWAVAGHHPDRVSTLTVASTPTPRPSPTPTAAPPVPAATTSTSDRATCG